ncbi:MAG: non-heme iron oxygenase ferredoxin subunit [Chloroflexi bacterium]|nr:non-heme iron oxygenase ferredoxin subunit [Chloroflexota bacterium]
MDETMIYHRIAKMIDLPEGERLFFELGGKSIVLFSLNGQFMATGDLCTHDQGPIGDGEIDGSTIICPRHGARFDLKTGKVLSFPAVMDIPIYPVRIVDEYIEVGLAE